MKIAMVILYIYSYHGGLVAHDHFFTLGECAVAAEEAAKFTKGLNIMFVCVPQVPDK